MHRTTKKRRRPVSSLFVMAALTSYYHYHVNIINPSNSNSMTMMAAVAVDALSPSILSPSRIRSRKIGSMSMFMYSNSLHGIGIGRGYYSPHQYQYHQHGEVLSTSTSTITFASTSSTTTALSAASRVDSSTHRSSKTSKSAPAPARSKGSSKRIKDDHQHQHLQQHQTTSNANVNVVNHGSTRTGNMPFDSWLDRTTARLLNYNNNSNNSKVNSVNANKKNNNNNNDNDIPLFLGTSPDKDSKININNTQQQQQHQSREDTKANDDSTSSIPLGQLTPDDVALLTTLMTSHARRSTAISATICERLLKRVVEEVNAGNTSVGVTTKMYTVVMDAWAKSQRRPLPGSGSGSGSSLSGNNGGGGKSSVGRRGGGGGAGAVPYGFEGKQQQQHQQSHSPSSTRKVINHLKQKRQTQQQGNDSNSNNKYQNNFRSNNGNSNSNTDNRRQQRLQQARKQNQQLQLHPQQTYPGSNSGSGNKQQHQKANNKHYTSITPLGAAAQRAHRIHNALVSTYSQTKDGQLAPSTISYNAAINAWSKSYHPSAGEMAELLLGEMLVEWRCGRMEEGLGVEGDLSMSMNMSDDNDNGHVVEERHRHHINYSGSGAIIAGKVELEDEGTSRSKKNQRTHQGNERVKPDVVTFTAVIDAWVKCTALAHDYHYSSPPSQSSSSNTDNGPSSDNAKGQQRKNTNKQQKLINAPTSDYEAVVTTNNKNNTMNYIEWKRSQASRADELTQRAANRAKQLLGLMIRLGHYDPERHVVVEQQQQREDTSGANEGRQQQQQQPLSRLTKCEPGMRPNCYTYSAVMNALAKSCSALRVHGGGSGNNRSPTNNRGVQRDTARQKWKQQSSAMSKPYDPAREAQDMLEDMIVKHGRYKERVGENGIWRGNASVGYYGDENGGWVLQQEMNEEEEEKKRTKEEDEHVEVDSKYEEWMAGSWKDAHFTDSSSDDSSNDKNVNLDEQSNDDDVEAKEDFDPNWFEPRPDELTFPPNTVNYNSVLNAWSRASRYDAHAASRAERILLNRMELSQSEGGDAVEPDALSYSLVIHSWLRGCRGNTKPGSSGQDKRRAAGRVLNYSDHDRIERAMKIVDRLEAWARKTHSHKFRGSVAGGAVSEEEEDSLSDGLLNDDDNDDDIDFDDSNNLSRQATPSTPYTFRRHNKARDLDVEVYNSILVGYSREKSGDHAASVMKLLDRMERLVDELDMPSVRPNQRSYNIALGVIANSASRSATSLAEYYKGDRKIEEDRREARNQTNQTNNIGRENKGGGGGGKPRRLFNPLYAGRAAESILSRMLAMHFRPDAYTFASVLNTYQRIPNGKLDAALSADAVVRGMESLHLHGRIDEPPDVFHYTMVCACWSRSGEQGVAGERCSEIMKHMQERDRDGFPRVKPNIRTFNAVIDSHAYNGREAEAEDMLISMVDNYESSAERSMDGIEDEELPIRPDSFSFNTVIHQWARSRSPEGGRRAEYILDRMIKFMNDGSADVRPDERSFAYIIYHYTKGAGRMNQDSPDRALKLLRRMIGMYRQGYTELLPSHHNKTNPIFAFTSVVDAHSVLRRSDSGSVGDELLKAMIKLGDKIEALRPNTYVYLSALYAWSSCGSVDAGEHATELLRNMEEDMAEATKRGEESIMSTTQRCYILAQTAWARSPSEKKAEGASEVLEMMERNFAGGNLDAKPTVQAYSMVLNACAFADMVQDKNARLVKASLQNQRKAFRIAEVTLNRIREEPYYNVLPNPVIYGTFIKCCGRLDLPENLAAESAMEVFKECRQAGLVSDFVLTQLRYALAPVQFLDVLIKNGYTDVDKKGKSISRDGKRIRHIRVNELPEDWTKNANRNK